MSPEACDSPRSERRDPSRVDFALWRTATGSSVHSIPFSGSVAVARSEAVSESPDAPWLAYLRQLAAGSVISDFVARETETLWRSLVNLTGTRALPRAMATENGGLFMAWDSNHHHLEIEISPTGRYDWFYSNRNNPAEYGGESYYPTRVLTSDLIAKFLLID
jgi:hypothetical protein